MPFDENVARVASHAIGEDFLAAGWFNVQADDGEIPGSLGGAILMLVGWIIRKQPWRWPSHSFWVVTAHDLWVLDLDIGEGVRLHKVVGRWPRRSVAASVGADSHRATVRVPGRPSVDVEGDRYDEGESAVLALLARSS